MRLTRRSALLSSLAASACASAKPVQHYPTDGDMPRIADTCLANARFGEIETRVGGRLGVAAWNSEYNAQLTHRLDERFAMCSMFKWLLAAQALAHEQEAPGFLAELVTFTEADLAGLGHAPVTRANLAGGSLTNEELVEAAIEQSDNGAANFLLRSLGGPEGFTQFLRANGDDITRLDRIEPALNENAPGDERDTTTAHAMVRNMAHFLTTDAVLHQAARDKLIGCLISNQAGAHRLRAGLPPNWRVGDKTGTSDSEHNATTDVAIAWPPGRAPIVIACFLSDSTVPLDQRNAAHAEVARIVAETWS